jgi:benzoylformate decarboxylase
MTGAEALMRGLLREGAEYVFGIPGATEVLFMDAMEDHPEIKYILCLHEVVAVGMAEGYARTSGKPGVLNLHDTTGLAAALPLLYNASQGQGGVPLVVTAGQQDTRILMQDAHMAGDLVRIASPFVKWGAEVAHAADIPLVMRRAFKMAMQPPTGPVFVSLPQDVLGESLDFHYPPVPPVFTRPRPDRAAVETAADLIAKAKNPVIIVEDGVTRSGALAEAVALAELVGARVYQPWMSDVNFPVNHPQYLGDLNVTTLKTREMLAGADVLVAVGARIFCQPLYLPQPLLTPRTSLIQIDDTPWQMAKNFPAAAGLEGDIRTSLGELLEILPKKMTAGARQAAAIRKKAIAGEKAKITAAFAEKAKAERNKVPIAVSRLMQELKEALPPGAIVIDDCWSASSTLRRTLDLTEPGSFQRARNGGSIGWGMPGALGAKLAAPDRAVVAVVGDGSAMWSVQSLWTAAHYKIPVTYIVLANAAYSQVRLMKTLMLGEGAKGRYLGTDLSGPRIDFSRLADAMGVAGTKVTKPGELGGALKTALGSGKPSLVEVSVEALY